MKLPLITLSLILALNTIASGKTGSNDWQVVKDIPPGWRIAVVTEFAFPCIFMRANDDELICRVPERRWTERDLPETHVRRGSVREIRADRRNGSNALMGAGIGGGTGAIFGAIASGGARGPAAYGLGALGVLMGARMGNDVHLLKGKVIYRAAPIPERSQAPDAARMSQIADTIARNVP